MAHYLLSVHSIEGEPPPPMTEADMQLFMKQIFALEAEMKTDGAFGVRLTDRAGCYRAVASEGSSPDRCFG